MNLESFHALKSKTTFINDHTEVDTRFSALKSKTTFNNDHFVVRTRFRTVSPKQHISKQVFLTIK